jgi:hypothetical protein
MPRSISDIESTFNILFLYISKYHRVRFPLEKLQHKTQLIFIMSNSFDQTYK